VTAPTPTSPPETAGGSDPGPIGAISGVLFSPARGFEQLAARPRWVAPLLLLVGLALALSLVLSPKMNMEKVIRDAMERSGQEVSEAQIQKQAEIAESFGWIGTVSQLFLQPAIYLLIAAIFLALFRMLGSEIDFRRSFAVTTHAFLPFALTTLLSIPVVMSRAEVSMEDVKGAGFIKSSLAALAPEEAGSALKALLGSVDLFSIWTLFLLATGYRVVARVGKGAAWGVVGTLWALYVAGKVAISGLF
jgi:hypothetical protein